MREAPFGLPMQDFGTWFRMQLTGIALTFIVIALVYRFVKMPFIGAISVAEAVGLVFAVVWMFGVAGPLSPFAYSEVPDDAC